MRYVSERRKQRGGVDDEAGDGLRVQAPVDLGDGHVPVVAEDEELEPARHGIDQPVLRDTGGSIEVELATRVRLSIGWRNDLHDQVRFTLHGFSTTVDVEPVRADVNQVRLDDVMRRQPNVVRGEEDLAELATIYVVADQTGQEVCASLVVPLR